MDADAEGALLESVRWAAQANAYRDDLPRDLRLRWARRALRAGARAPGTAATRACQDLQHLDHRAPRS